MRWRQSCSSGPLRSIGYTLRASAGLTPTHPSCVSIYIEMCVCVYVRTYVRNDTLKKRCVPARAHTRADRPPWKCTHGADMLRGCPRYSLLHYAPIWCESFPYSGAPQPWAQAAAPPRSGCSSTRPIRPSSCTSLSGGATARAHLHIGVRLLIEAMPPNRPCV